VTGFHDGEPHEGRPKDLPQRVVGATLGDDDRARVIANRESIRAAYEDQKPEEN